MTTSNMLYEIDFDRYYLRRDETVFVRQQQMQGLIGIAKSFDIVLDAQFNQ